MKKTLFIITLLFSFNLFSQTTIDLGISPKEYKKIAKKLDLKILNRGYNGNGLVFATQSGSTYQSHYTRIWNEVFFEMNMPLGSITSEDSDVIVYDADFLFEISGRRWRNGYGEAASGGGFSGRILDFNNSSRVVLTFTTKQKMTFITGKPSFKRAQEFKKYVQVIVNEILLTIK